MKTNTDAVTVSKETNDISQNEEIAMVEYNNENVYLGVLQDSMLTFTKQQLGKLGADFVIKDLNFSLNKKDRQKINSAYIIVNIKCKIVKNKFAINDEQKKDLENAVKNYLVGKNAENVADKDSLKDNGE
ncbi:uncharacterized protein LOC127709676 [Mytilus californianus]|uniref:uncharacterized protein LOC127709676 n=1 Tax=Mytilus californianus TaxID=6549 RepID=UPI002246FFAC|nr:uncharacterized protein LOC127709676 [Mytilus californianus]